MGGSGYLKFVAQLHKCKLEIQIFKAFAETVQGHHVQVKDRKHLEQLFIIEKGKT